MQGKPHLISAPAVAPAAGNLAVNVVVVGLDELRTLIRTEIEAAVRAASAPASDWLDADQVAELLGYRRKYVPELVRRHGLPAHQPGGRGGRLMFRRAEVEAWAAARSTR